MKFVNSYRLLDHLGSLRIARGDIGAPEGGVSSEVDLYPFGSPFASAVANSRRQFTGHERDASAGMDYMLARYVSGGQLRFLSTDPGAPDTATESIQRWNKFSYAVNNPLQMIDPDGRDSFLCTRPLAFYEGAGHMFVTTGGAAPGDRNATVNSAGDRGDDITGKVDGNTKGFSEGTNKDDHAAWLSAGQPGSTTECVPIPAPDAVVQSLADSVVEDLPYSALPGLLGDYTLGASTNSNSVAQAVANQAAGQPIPSPGSLPVPGAANWTSVGFDTNKDGKRDPSRVPNPPPPPPPPVPTDRPIDKR
jgi:RHS repeat-associated protein